MTETTERIVLASRPVGEPTLDNFRLEELPIPQPGPDQMLLRTLWLSLDPYMRGRMSDAPSYAKPVGIGDVMEGGTVSEVVASNVPRFAKGDIVVGRTGWQTPCAVRWLQFAEGRSHASANSDRTRRPRDAGYDRLHGAARDRQAGRWRNRGGRGSFGCGRLGCRPDRSDQGCPRRRHRGRTRQMQVRDRGARLRCLHRPSGTRFRRPSCRSLPERYRRLFRECRRRGIRGRVPTAQSVRPHSGVRADLHVQRHLAVTRSRSFCRT